MSKKIKMPTNRNFGIVFFIIFLIISIWPLLNENQIRFWSLAISLIFFVLGAINSKLLTPLNKVWFKFGILIGNIIAPIVMGIIFFNCHSYWNNFKTFWKRFAESKKKYKQYVLDK